MKKELRLISKEIFINESKKYKELPKLKRVEYFGFYKNEVLIGVMLTSLPKTRNNRIRYTVEINSIEIFGGLNLIEESKVLLNEYFLNKRPIEVFFNTNSFDKADELGNLLSLKFDEVPPRDVLVKDTKTYFDSKNNYSDWVEVNELESDFKLNGYHREYINSSKNYFWRNPEVSFYIYKITSPEDKGYYIGRHISRIKDPKESDFLNDGYMGSGGERFQLWKKNKVLTKEIISMPESWRKMLSTEDELIGDAYERDTNCLNSAPGYTGDVARGPLYEIRKCSKHGSTPHQGSKCSKCSSQSSIKYKECSIHGLVKFLGDICSTCNSNKAVSVRTCYIHGETKHQGNVCSRCNSLGSVSVKDCEIHGETKYQGVFCCKCLAKGLYDERICKVHGNVLHRKDICLTCSANNTINLKNCDIHGYVKHKGISCCSCVNDKKQKNILKECNIHGLTKFNGNSCYSCESIKKHEIKKCETHGNVKFSGDSCVKCTRAKTIVTKDCSIHGSTKFYGNVCAKCNSAKVIKKECMVHGLVNFKGESCLKCSMKSVIKHCNIHGETKFRGDSCFKCRSTKMLETRNRNKASKSLKT